jgi:hypothetical protein
VFRRIPETDSLAARKISAERFGLLRRGRYPLFERRFPTDRFHFLDADLAVSPVIRLRSEFSVPPK